MEIADRGSRWAWFSGRAHVCSDLLDADLFPARARLDARDNPGDGLALLLLTFGCSGCTPAAVIATVGRARRLRGAPLSRFGMRHAVSGLLLLPAACCCQQVELALVLWAPGIFFLSLAMGTSPAALQRIFPNQVRGQVSALYLFLLNLGGLSLGPLLPGFLNDRLFHNGRWSARRWRSPSGRRQY